MDKLQRQLEKLLQLHKGHSLWRKTVSVLGCAVVFCTTYALILPAITLEGATYCGQEEHTHTDACYTQTLTCAETDDSHTHTEDCYASVLTCALPEHTHTAECFVNPDSADSSTNNSTEPPPILIRR